MAQDEKFEHLTTPIKVLSSLLNKKNWKGMIIGGVAASILGIPRFTKDIDAVISLEDDDLDLFLEEAGKIGIIPRINNVKEFALKNKVILLKHKDSEIYLDISLAILPFEKKAIKKRRIINIKDIELYVPTPEDLIIFKAVAHRQQDLLDIEGIIMSNPNLNRTYIIKHLKEFASVLEMPEILEDIKKVMKKK